MHQFAPLFYFVTIVLVFRPIRTADHDGNTPNPMRNIEAGMGVVIGAIIDNSSRVGKEERVAMEMAMEDFYANGNQRLVLQIRHSLQTDPMQAALAGWHVYFWLFFFCRRTFGCLSILLYQTNERF